MFDLIKAWPPQLQLVALAMTVVACLAAIIVVVNVISGTLITLRHGYPPPSEPTPETPEFTYSYTGPPEHAPKWLRPKADAEPERTDP
jgi:hypothetical protein